MAGRKPMGHIDPYLAGGFYKEPEGKHKDRQLKRMGKQEQQSAYDFAVAYRLEQYAKAGVLTRRITDHPRSDWLWKIRKQFKGDVLAQCPSKHLVYGPFDKPFKGDEWLHERNHVGRGIPLYDWLEEIGLPPL
jgi:hypothetical protein